MSFEQMTALLGAVLSLSVSAMYMRQTARGEIKPHMFTWLIWGLLMVIGAAAQYSDGAGTGALMTGFLGLVNLIIAGQAFFVGEKKITRSDWATFLAALAAIPLWMATANPLAAVLLVIGINFLGMVPTYRKSLKEPHQESVAVFAVGLAISLMLILSIEHYSLTTILFPVYLLAANASLVVLLVVRRRVLAAAQAGSA